MNSMMKPSYIKKIRIAIIVNIFAILALFLFTNEILVTIFNVHLEQQGYSLAQRIPLAFKPRVIVIYLVFSVILFLLIFRYLKPLFKYLSNGEEYDKARIAVIRMPWAIIAFQIAAWFIGTTVYYATRAWVGETGIPYHINLPLKLSSGFVAAIYVVFIINYILRNAKLHLKITDIRDGEYDSFSRIKDYFAISSSSFFIFMNTIYIAYYYSVRTEKVADSDFLLMVIPTGIVLIVAAIGTIVLARKEYKFQIKNLLNEMKNLAEGDSSSSDRIYLINFDELGDMTVFVNKIVDQFQNLLGNIQQTVQRLSESAAALSSASQQSSTASNQQAASVAEVVSTMEDTDRLSKSMEERAKEVEERSSNTKLSVEEGVKTINNHIKNMEAIKDANTETLDFIRSLNMDIKAIWEVVTIINSIADQVKIIAFNAELEASAAGAAGKNFEIVATEIRRLADNTVASTMEIRNKISLIENAARGLVDASGKTTEYIEGGWEISTKTESVFNTILGSSEDTLETSHVIAKNIRLQIHAFEQILLTMKQIAEGAAGFSQSTKTTSETARDLKELVETLSSTAGAGQ